MAFKGGIALQLLLLADSALPLRAATLQGAQGEALLRRAGDGAAAGEADGLGSTVSLQHLIDEHAASEAELHARAAEAFRRFSDSMADSGCSYKGGLLPCPNNMICYYEGVAGVNVSATVEYRGNIIKTTLHPDPDAGLDQPDLVTFMGAGTNDAPAMLLDVPAEYRRTANPVMLKMFFVEDTDNVTEQCPHDSERVESMGNESASYSVENGTRLSVSTGSRTTNMFMGMGFNFISETEVGHTHAFEIPVGTEIVWVSREELVQVLLTQELPASLEARMTAQLRKSALARGMDDALTQKGSRRRRRRRWCSGAGAMIGGAAAVGVAFAVCAFTFIGCFTAAPFLIMAGTGAMVGGACNCWSKQDDWHSTNACGLNAPR